MSPTATSWIFCRKRTSSIILIDSLVVVMCLLFMDYLSLLYTVTVQNDSTPETLMSASACHPCEAVPWSTHN